MIKLSGIVVSLASVMFLAACTATPRIQSDYSDELDFGEYKTFNLVRRTATEDSGLAGDLELYFSAAVMRELRVKGLAMSDDPDILVNVSVDVEDVSRPPVRGTICPKYEDYYSRHFADGFSGQGRRPMCIYTEGSITVGLTDVSKSVPMMEAVSRVRLDKNDRGAILLLSVSYDVATMFGESPIRDGRLVAGMRSN